MEINRALDQDDWRLDMGASMRCVMLCVIFAVASSVAGAQSQPTAQSVGLGEDFIARALGEFKALGFMGITRFADLSAPPKDMPREVALQMARAPKKALFSVMSGYGATIECWVALRPDQIPGSAEHRLGRAAVSFGAEEVAVWRVMFRHELGHCALGMMSRSAGAPDIFLAEPFADVFALEWSTRVDRSGSSLTQGYAMARRRLSGGAHATWNEIERWRAAPVQGPCQAAWSVAPIDARDSGQACPAGKFPSRIFAP